jgi:hypothetical protein
MTFVIIVAFFTGISATAGPILDGTPWAKESDFL